MAKSKAKSDNGKRSQKPRQPRGMGSCFYHKGRKVWVARGPGGRPEVSAKTQAKAAARLQERLRERDGPDRDRATVAEWAAEWLAHLQTRTSTAADYRDSVARFVVPQLGRLLVRDVTAADVQRAITAWGKTLGVNTVRKTVRVLSALFTAAVHAGRAAANPVKLAKKPRGVRPKTEVYSPAELTRVVRSAGLCKSGPVLATLAATGCRIGEALALDVPDFDPRRKTLNITKTFHRRFGIGPPKTENGARLIDVPDELVPVLAAAAKGRAAGPLFLTLRGNRQTAATVRVGWAYLAGRLGLPVRKPHAFRHSVATNMIAAGAPIPEVAAYLGDSPETIVKTYLQRTRASPVAVLNALLGGHKVGAPPAAPANPLKIAGNPAG